MTSPYSTMSTPSSTSSTANLAPAPPTLAIKPVSMGSNSMGSPMNSCNSPVSLGLGPTREWVIPPRPKPGRKPATDTPPTKRKAQNRAAQRAFRERRAARVGELEEQLKETEEERLKREAQTKAELDDARSHVAKLEADMQRVLNEVIEWRQKYHRAEDMLEAERAEKATLNTELIYLRKGARAIGTDAVVLPPRRNRAHLKPESAQLQNPAPTPNADPLGCGNCTSTSGCACVEKVMVMATSACGRCSVDSHCECLEETLKAPNTAGGAMEIEVKRSRDSSPFTNSKRTRMSIEDNTPQEIDFTSMFSSKPIYAPEPPPRDYGTTNAASRPPPGESCGFCDDSTYCACAEAAEVAARELEHENRLPPLMSEVTPPPSDSDVNAVDSYKLPSLYPSRHIQSLAPASKSAGSPSNSCANGPGTCQQCQDDPKSGLFCRSLAAIRAADPSFSGCCGQGGPGGCCKDPPSQPPPRPEPRKSKPVLPGPALSCAETYKTLASHRNFEAASDEISKWLPKLATAPPRYPGREATDIDAASVMSVIKYFDVRFGRE